MRSSSDLIAITPGEPAGIGPDIVLQAAATGALSDCVAIANPELLTARARKIGVPVKLIAADAASAGAGELRVHALDMQGSHAAGIADPANAHYLLESLTIAARGCESNTFAAMVTGPINKQSINEAGIAFSGHTEFLAELTNTPRVVMMLATPGLRVALATTHLPLREVPDAITGPLLEEITGILHHALQSYFDAPSPHILVAGLNPHAGEGGYLGREEIDIISPCLEALRKQGMQLEGPLPADTLFTPKYLERADAVLAMYHDQGLPVLKYQGFGNAVNITLGLPIIRTSVDHGTALDLAGSGRADTGSLLYALDVAREMASGRRKHLTG